MLLPKPVLLAILLIAYCLGHLITWIEQGISRYKTSTRSVSDADKVIVNGRLA